MQIEQPTHGVFGHAELLGELDLGPAMCAHCLVNGQLRGHERREHCTVGSRMSRALPRQRLPSLHVSFESRDDAVAGVCPCLLFGLAFGQRLRDSGKANKPPTILLPLQRVSISKRHDHSSKSSLAKPNWPSIALRRPGWGGARCTILGSYAIVVGSVQVCRAFGNP